MAPATSSIYMIYLSYIMSELPSDIILKFTIGNGKFYVAA